MSEGKIDARQGLMPLIIIGAGMLFMLAVHHYLDHGPASGTTLRRESGEFFGLAGLACVIVIYGRSLLKIALNQGTLLQRFIPQEQYDLSVSTSKKLLNLLNRTHKHVGAAAVGILCGHALLLGDLQWNTFLKMVLSLVVWQGIFGTFLVMRFPPPALKRYGYLVHAQLFSGVGIGILATTGHFLL